MASGVRCPEPLSEEAFARLAEIGISSPKFTALCAWLVMELRAICPLEEDVNPTHGPEDAETFQIEVSGLLSELHCPYPSLTAGNVTARLCDPESCLQLLYFLSSELQAARLLSRKRLRSSQQDQEGSSEALQELRLLCQALSMPEPALSCPLTQLLGDIERQVSVALAALPPGHPGRAPLLTAPLTAHQWEVLEWIHKELCAEYQCRKRMMMARLDVTIQSFHWSERAKIHGAAMHEVFALLWQAPLTESAVSLAHLLAARVEASRIVKTSSGNSRDRTSCTVNKVLMGRVPDRGGRPSELEPPMPVWEKRREGGGGDGHQRWSKRGKKKKK